jgi:hypothetical protein
MIKFFLKVVLVVFPLCFSAQDFGTEESIFNKFYLNSCPNNLLENTQENIILRSKYKIRTIIVKKILSQNYFDSLIKIDIKNFIPNHTSTIEYFKYSKNGIPLAYSILPLNVKINGSDSVMISKQEIIENKLNKEYIINYYSNNILNQQEVYANETLKKVIYFKKYVITGLNKIQKTKIDTIIFCNKLIDFRYNDKKEIISRDYNFTNNFRVNIGCYFMEHEDYQYSKSKIVITKIPFRETEKHNKKYINKIELNKNNQIVKSTFYLSSLKDPFVIYTCEYDEKNNLKSIYESYDLKKPLDYKICIYENKYDASGTLVEKIESRPTENMPYKEKHLYYNKHGLISKIEYIYKEGGSLKEEYEYSFY